MTETPSVEQPVLVPVRPAGYAAGMLALGCTDPAAATAVILGGASSAVVVADENVISHQGGFIQGLTDIAACPVHIFTFPAGESSKSMDTVASCLGFMARAGVDRQSVVVGFGGGVTTDMAAMVAALWMRGVRLVLVPTSLLAMADAAIGGKGAVNIPEGRNLSGCMKFPEYVFVHPAYLETLPSIERISGLVEIVKTAVVGDHGLLERILALPDLDDAAILGRLASSAATFKAGVVTADPDDRGIRRILNFGHTVGHAIESATHYQVGHGAAVSVGMVVESSIAVRMGIMDWRLREKLIEVLHRTGAPVAPTTGPLQAMQYMKRDKKSLSGSIRMSLPGSNPLPSGETRFDTTPVPESLIMECWNG